MKSQRKSNLQLQLVEACQSKNFDAVKRHIELGADVSYEKFLALRVSIRSPDIFQFLISDKKLQVKTLSELLRLGVIFHQEKIMEQLVLHTDITPEACRKAFIMAQKQEYIQQNICIHMNTLLKLRAELDCLRDLPLANTKRKSTLKI